MDVDVEDRLTCLLTRIDANFEACDGWVALKQGLWPSTQHGMNATRIYGMSVRGMNCPPIPKTSIFIGILGANSLTAEVSMVNLEARK